MFCHFKKNILLFLPYLRTYVKYTCKTISASCLKLYKLMLLMLTFPMMAVTTEFGVMPNWVSVLPVSLSICVIIRKVLTSPILSYLIWKAWAIIIPTSAIMRIKQDDRHLEVITSPIHLFVIHARCLTSVISCIYPNICIVASNTLFLKLKVWQLVVAIIFKWLQSILLEYI